MSSQKNNFHIIKSTQSLIMGSQMIQYQIVIFLGRRVRIRLYGIDISKIRLVCSVKSRRFQLKNDYLQSLQQSLDNLFFQNINIFKHLFFKSQNIRHLSSSLLIQQPKNQPIIINIIFIYFIHIIIFKNMQNIQNQIYARVQMGQKNQQIIINHDQLQKNQLSLNKQIIKEDKQEVDHSNVQEGEMVDEGLGHFDGLDLRKGRVNQEKMEDQKNGLKQLMDQDKEQQSMPKINKKTSKISTGGCNCLRSKCLKNYCQCFTQGKKCTQQCKCLSCQNTVQSQTKNKNNLEGLQIGERSCSCKKSNCQKKYCQCFNNGFKCHKSCKCQDCKNTQNYISKEQQIAPLVMAVKQQSKKQKSAEEMQQIYSKLTQILKKSPQQYHSHLIEFISYLLS